MNILALPNKELVYLFRKFYTKYRMIISRNTGKLNHNFYVKKSQFIDLLYFATVQGSDGDTPQSYPTKEELEEEAKNTEPHYVKGKRFPDRIVPDKRIHHIHNTDELKDYIEPLYIIENHMNSYYDFVEFTNEIYAALMGCFEIRECREYPVYFKFRHSDSETYVLELRQFVLNLFAWYALVPLQGRDIINKDHILLAEDMYHVHSWIDDRILETLQNYQIKSTTINEGISEVIFRFRRISDDFSLLLNVNFTLKTILDFAKKYPEAKEIMEATYDDNAQPADVETIGEQKLSRLMELFIADENNPIGVILKSGTGIKAKQLAESLIESGQISDIDGNTIPIIRSNSILQGARKPSEIYLSASGGRKPLLMNKLKMGSAGYFAKELTMLASTLKLSRTVSDCGTKHLLPYHIRSAAYLKKFDGKFYKLHPKDRDLLCLNARKDKHLIGKTIYVRSVITCGCHGDEVCHKCWGKTSILNFDIPDGVAAHDAEEIGQVIQQKILSTKHLLTTKSERIEFDGPFDKFFSITCGQISANGDIEMDPEDDYVLYVKPSDITRLDELDSDSLFNTCVSNGTFYLINEGKPDSEPIKINTTNGKELYLSNEILAIMKKNKGRIHLNEIGDEFTIFEITVTNNELTRPFNDIKDLLNSSKKRGEENSESIEGIAQRILDLMVEAKMDAPITSAECLINRIVTKKDTFERPDFSVDDIGDYQIITVRQALEKGKYPLIGLSFEYLKRQILTDELYETRTTESYTDSLFQKQVSTANLKKYNKMIGKEAVSKFLHY